MAHDLTAPDSAANDAAARRPAAQEYPFTISYVLPGRALLPGDICDINLQGAVIAFGARRCPHYTCKAEALLQLKDAQTGRTLPVHAEHLESALCGKHRQCWFSFRDPSALFQKLPAALRRFFNRRSAFRVPPSHEEPVTVDIGCPTGAHTGGLLDISAGGMALALSGEAAEALAASRHVQIRALLPGADSAIVVVARPCTSTSTEGGWRVGFAFDREKTENFADHEARVIRYIMRRQQEELRSRAEALAPPLAPRT